MARPDTLLKRIQELEAQLAREHASERDAILDPITDAADQARRWSGHRDELIHAALKQVPGKVSRQEIADAAGVSGAALRQGKWIRG